MSAEPGATAAAGDTGASMGSSGAELISPTSFHGGHYTPPPPQHAAAALPMADGAASHVAEMAARFGGSARDRHAAASPPFPDLLVTAPPAAAPPAAATTDSGSSPLMMNASSYTRPPAPPMRRSRSRQNADSVTSSDVDTVILNIERLHELHQRGLLTDEEFGLAKRKMLEPSPPHSHRPSTRSRRSTRTRRSRSSSSSSSSGSGFFVPQRTSLWKAVAPFPVGGGGADGSSPALMPEHHRSVPVTSNEFGTPTPAGSAAEHGGTGSGGPDAQAYLDAGRRRHRDAHAGEKVPLIGAIPPAIDAAKAANMSSTYGSFGTAASPTAPTRISPVIQRKRLLPPLLPHGSVRVSYFNSRGKVGKTYEDVALFAARRNCFSSSSSSSAPLSHGVRPNGTSSPLSPLSNDDMDANGDGGTTQARRAGYPAGAAGAGAEGAVVVKRGKKKLGKGSTKPPIPDIVGGDHGATGPETHAEDSNHSSLNALRELSRHSSSSTLVLSFDWHWVDVCGRDQTTADYRRTMQKLTDDFGLCSSLLVDRDHQLVMPQFLEAASNEHQHLVVLRVANPQINPTDDSVLELSNRWLMLIDTDQKLVITIHRIDAAPIALLRQRWADLMRNTVAFEEFLLKLLDDAVATYSESLDVHERVLDMCEAKLLHTSGGGRATTNRSARRASPEALALKRTRNLLITQHFEHAAETPLLQALISGDGDIDRSEMNAFLYHLHRRSNVQHRILATTSPVLRKCFTEFRLCSKDRSAQMCGFCNDLAAKALEVRDNAQHLLTLHINLVSFQTNELMAILTKFSIFFAPLSFLAGVYGVNFEWVPEFEIEYMYFYFWLMVLGIVTGLYIFFHRKGVM